MVGNSLLWLAREDVRMSCLFGSIVLAPLHALEDFLGTYGLTGRISAERGRLERLEGGSSPC